jgi:hypothetical protein
LECGILEIEGAFAQAQLEAIETGRNVPGWLVSHCRRYATAAGVPRSEAIPDAVWAEAVEAFDWEAVARGATADGEDGTTKGE